MAQLNLSLPSFQGMDLSDEKQLRKLTSYLYRLDEQLRYVLNNLGEENLSDSLRAIINTQTDATVLDEMTGQVQRLSTQIVQTAQAISLKADKETLDALGETLGHSIAELEVTAEEIRAEVSDTASGLQSQINQTAEAIEMKASKEEVQTIQRAAEGAVQTATGAQATANAAAGAAGANAEAIGELVTRVTTAETQIRQTANDITLKASKEEVETVQQVATGAAGAAASAQSTANAAAGAAANAQNAASEAAQAAQNAQSTANSAQTSADALAQRVTKAESEIAVQADQIRAAVTKEEFVVVEQAAQQAQNTASNAAGAASNAQSTANNAAQAAQQAQNAADEAQAGTEALAGRVTKAEAKLTVQADEIALRVTKTQHEADLSGKLNADAPAIGVQTASAVVNEKGVYLSGGEIDMRTTDGEDYLNLSSAGVSASSMSAPDVAVRYDGGSWIGVNPQYTASEIAAGNRYRSLSDAFNALKCKVVEEYITIQILSGSALYENATLQGTRFLSGCTITTSDGPATASVYGSVEINHCAGYIKIQYVEFYPADGQRAITAYGKAGFIHMIHCCLHGRAKTTGTYAVGAMISDGASCQAEFCEFYDFSYAIEVASLASLNVQSGNKGNCNLYVRKGFLFVTGAAPSANANEWQYTYNGAHFCNTSNVTVDQGSGSSTPAIPTIGSIGVYTEETASYNASGAVWSDDNVTQGWWEGGGRIRGVMWFYNDLIRSELAGKSLLSATLRLHMKTSGRGTQVTVELAGTSANVGGNPAVTKTYGAIATMSPKETATITLPVQAVNDLVSGTINGLMLYSSDTGPHKEREYSKNYAAFAGADSGDALKPVLTITYEG